MAGFVADAGEGMRSIFIPRSIVETAGRRWNGVRIMLRCSPEAFAKCPMQRPCGSQQEALFLEGSECDKFNQDVEKEKNMHKNIEEWISEGVRPYIIFGSSTGAGIIFGILAIASAIAAFWHLWLILSFAVCGVLCGAMLGIASWVYDVAL